MWSLARPAPKLGQVFSCGEAEKNWAGRAAEVSSANHALGWMAGVLRVPLHAVFAFDVPAQGHQCAVQRLGSVGRGRGCEGARRWGEGLG
jgi:hypothetical protein